MKDFMKAVLHDFAVALLRRESGDGFWKKYGQSKYVKPKSCDCDTVAIGSTMYFYDEDASLLTEVVVCHIEDGVPYFVWNRTDRGPCLEPATRDAGVFADIGAAANDAKEAIRNDCDFYGKRYAQAAAAAQWLEDDTDSNAD